MPTTTFVDSRMRTAGGTDSQFEINLRETVHMSTNARVRVDKATFTDSFLTTDAGTHLYFRDIGEGISVFTITDGAYTGASLPSAIQSATGRSTFYDTLTSSITHTLAAPNQPWLSDSVLETHTGGGFPVGASRSDPRSLDSVLGNGENNGAQVVGNFVRMSPYKYVLLRSCRLRCVDNHGPRGTHDILCHIPLTGGAGTQVESSSPDGMYHKLQGELSF